MNGRYLLDTSVIIALFAGDESVTQEIEKAAEIFIPCIAVGELYYGARKSAKSEESLATIEQFVGDNVVLECDVETARHYGEIKNALRVKGRPIPENDIWIAAIALQHDLTLAARDVHFSQIVDLKMSTW